MIEKKEFKELFIELNKEIEALGEYKVDEPKDANDERISKQDELYKRFIRNLEKKNILSKEAADYTEMYYGNRNYLYKKTYRVVHKAFGRAESFSIINPDTKQIIKKKATLKDYAPNNYSVAKYSSGLDNPFVLTFPGVKKLERFLYKILYKYNGDHTKALDAFRLSARGKFLGDLKEIQKRVEKVENVKIDPKKTKNNFGENDLKRLLKQNEDNFKFKNIRYKNFRNLVMYLELENGANVEMQLKIHAFERVDALTYDKYKENRVEDDSLKATLLEKEILKMYRWTIEKYNQNEVLKTLSEIEAECDAMNYQKNEDGFYPECINFLEENFLVRPTQVLNLDNPLPNLTPEDKKLFNLDKIDKDDYLHELLEDAQPELHEAFYKYEKFIIPKYVNVLNQESLKPKQTKNLGTKKDIKDYHKLFLNEKKSR